jgi:hypothetical protein
MFQNKPSFRIALAVFLVLMPSIAAAKPYDIKDESVGIWRGLSDDEKHAVLSGYIDCTRSQNPPVAVLWGNSEVERIDKALDAATGMSAVLYSLRNDRTRVAPNPNAEHFSGKYGFHTGMWWRELEPKEKVAYLRGVEWCSVSFGAPGAAAFTRVDPAEIVAAMDKWYVVEDEEARLPLTNQRADIPIMVALMRSHMLAQVTASKRARRS